MMVGWCGHWGQHLFSGPFIEHHYFIIVLFYSLFMLVYACFSPRVDCPGCDHDCFECQCCRGYSHSSHLLQVNSSEDNAGRNAFQTWEKEWKQCRFSVLYWSERTWSESGLDSVCAHGRARVSVSLMSGRTGKSVSCRRSGHISTNSYLAPWTRRRCHWR